MNENACSFHLCFLLERTCAYLLRCFLIDDVERLNVHIGGIQRMTSAHYLIGVCYDILPLPITAQFRLSPAPFRQTRKYFTKRLRASRRAQQPRFLENGVHRVLKFPVIANIT